jgi:BolA protein
MSMQTTIEQKLSSEFEVDYLQVENESHLHSVAPGAESHFKVTIVSNSFDEQMLIKRHRQVNQVLQQEMKQIHALALHTLTPQEWQTRNGQVAASPKCRGGGKNQ